MVGDTGIEPVTSSVSRKRAPAAPIARVLLARWRRDLNPCTRLCRPLPRLSATPPSCRLEITWRPPSGRRDSNPRPSPWQGDALPTEPRPHATGTCGSGPRCACNHNNPPMGQANRTEARTSNRLDVHGPGGIGYRESPRAIGAVVARFVHTEEVTGSNPVSPTASPLVRGRSAAWSHGHAPE